MLPSWSSVTLWVCFRKHSTLFFRPPEFVCSSEWRNLVIDGSRRKCQQQQACNTKTMGCYWRIALLCFRISFPFCSFFDVKKKDFVSIWRVISGLSTPYCVAAGKRRTVLIGEGGTRHFLPYLPTTMWLVRQIRRTWKTIVSDWNRNRTRSNYRLNIYDWIIPKYLIVRAFLHNVCVRTRYFYFLKQYFPRISVILVAVFYATQFNRKFCWTIFQKIPFAIFGIFEVNLFCWFHVNNDVIEAKDFPGTKGVVEKQL